MNPWALKNVDPELMAVIFDERPKGMGIKHVFWSGSKTDFVPFIENFNNVYNLDNKGVLLIDDAPCRSPF